jgi:hypothetical protein
MCVEKGPRNTRAMRLVKPRTQHKYLLVHARAGTQTPEMLLSIDDSYFLELLKPFTSPGYFKVEVVTCVFIPTPETPVHHDNGR